jgi:hypothetical protein
VTIDAHTHLFPPAQGEARDAIASRDAGFAEIYGDPGAAIADAPALLAALREDGVEAAVALGFAFAGEREVAEQNEYLLAVAAETPRAIVPFATVNPALPGWEREARRVLDHGARGFGELRPGTQGWDPLGPEGRRLADLAREAGAALVWHTSEPVGHRYPGKEGGLAPAELIEVAAAAPEVTMVGAHLGAGASFYLSMPEVREATPNLLFDTAAASLLYDAETIARLVATAGAGRVLFGSDFPLRRPGSELKCVLAGLDAPTGVAVAGENARGRLC